MSCASMLKWLHRIVNRFRYVKLLLGMCKTGSACTYMCIHAAIHYCIWDSPASCLFLPLTNTQQSLPTLLRYYPLFDEAGLVIGHIFINKQTWKCIAMPPIIYSL